MNRWTIFLRRLCKQRVGHNQKSDDWRHITDAYRLDIDMFYPLKEERKMDEKQNKRKNRSDDDRQIGFFDGT